MTSFPNYIARIRRYESDWALSQAPGEIKCQIDGYRILLTFAGALQGNFVFLGHQVPELQQIIAKMAFWYFLHRIDPDKDRYKRWKQ